jgi:hypothetical protein
LGALVGMGTMSLWQRRASWVGRSALAGALVVTTIWAVVLLDRTPAWFPWLRVVVAVAGALGALAILALPWLRRVPNAAVGLVAVLGFGAALAAPLFSTVATAATPHSGAIPTVTPSASGGFGGPGGGFGGPGGGGFRRLGGIPGGFPGGTRGGRAGGGFTPPGGFVPGRGTGGGFTPPAFAGGRGGTFGGGFGGGVGGAGGILGSSTPGSAVTKLLQADAGSYSWVAATTNSNSAAGYQLASNDPVMAIGGFNGTDPAPSLAQFEKYVTEGRIHYYISGGRGLGAGGFGGAGGGTSDVASQISTWVESHFTAQTVDGTTLYNLTQPTTSS